MTSDSAPPGTIASADGLLHFGVGGGGGGGGAMTVTVTLVVTPAPDQPPLVNPKLFDTRLAVPLEVLIRTRSGGTAAAPPSFAGLFGIAEPEDVAFPGSEAEELAEAGARPEGRRAAAIDAAVERERRCTRVVRSHQLADVDAGEQGSFVLEHVGASVGYFAGGGAHERIVASPVAAPVVASE